MCTIFDSNCKGENVKVQSYASKIVPKSLNFEQSERITTKPQTPVLPEWNVNKCCYEIFMIFLCLWSKYVA